MAIGVPASSGVFGQVTTVQAPITLWAQRLADAFVVLPKAVFKM
jgi:hypothetical protein